MSVITVANAWLAQDPDPETRSKLGETIALAETGDAHALAELEQAFSQRLQFGTAGLRGKLGFGSARMNRVLVAQAAAGFSQFLLTRSERPTLVIGFDGRHNSHVFAQDTAEIAAAQGVNVLLMPRALPTPVLAFALRYIDADGGVMVTASHNPAQDNGYKVYLGGDDQGAQIVSPTDAQIAALIAQVATGDIRELPRSSSYGEIPEAVIDAYIETTAQAVITPVTKHVPFVYTAMHGVGYDIAASALELAGFGKPYVVSAQRDPDPDFPTAPFPNPEEPGALDLAIELAKSTDAKVIIANDPDADRLAIGALIDGDWQRLSGNQVGALFGQWIASGDGQQSAQAEATDGRGVFASSLVSSPLLAKIAAQNGFEYVQTLTGFKYISRVPGLVFGYEEALGYLVNPADVHDKDGISAAVAFMSIVAALDKRGLSIADALAELDAQYGAYASGQLSIRNSDANALAALVAGIRETQPDTVAGIQVTQWIDYAEGIGDWPPQNILRADLADGSRIVIRPSGTEPKVKMYIDVVAANHASAVAKLAELQTTGGQLLGS